MNAPITLQEAFNKVWLLAQVQRKPAKHPDGSCMYLDFNKNRCAIGAILPEDLLDLVCADYGDVELIIGTHPEVREFLSLGSITAWRMLQGCHDTPQSDFHWSERFQRKLMDFAFRYNLKFPNLGNVPHHRALVAL